MKKIFGIPDNYKINDYKLCLASGNTLYFTTQDMNKQKGTDWNIMPFTKSGVPFESSEWSILKIEYWCDKFYIQSLLSNVHIIKTRGTYFIGYDDDILAANMTILECVDVIFKLNGHVIINDEKIDELNFKIKLLEYE